MTVQTDDLDSALGPLAPFAGRWIGGGEGHYPTIDDFSYEEEIDLAWDGRPFLTYVSRTWSPGRAKPMHTENGFLRRAGEAVELLITQPTGFAELHRGPVVGGVFAPEQLSLARSPDAKPVHSVRRTLTVAGDHFSYEFSMAHGDTPMTHHLSGRLHRAR
ncbi:MAG: FABP family protein [Tomitella sp.]|nr:FABP family protein [Tomitella sp.]